VSSYLSRDLIASCVAFRDSDDIFLDSMAGGVLRTSSGSALSLLRCILYLLVTSTRSALSLLLLLCILFRPSRDCVSIHLKVGSQVMLRSRSSGLVLNDPAPWRFFYARST